VILIHPWESGLDNAPYWLQAARQNQFPTWIRVVEKLHLEPVVRLVRGDTRYLPRNQRMHTIDSLIYFAVLRRLRRKMYDSEKILRRSHFTVEDVAFNSILVRANTHLGTIADTLKQELPEELKDRFGKARKALLSLWDEDTRYYLSRDYTSNKLMDSPSVASLLPLYAGVVPKEQAAILIKRLRDTHKYWATFPVPSVPLNAREFQPERYWDGPTWININWLLIDGLKRTKEGHDLAADLTAKTINLVQEQGIHEYYNPLTGQGLGAPDFSWTAALVLDLLNN